MSYRGRLINPFMIELAQLDLVASEVAGVDRDFKEAKLVSTLDGVGENTRAETLIRVPGQFERTIDFEKLQESSTGNLGRLWMIVMFHFASLEAMGLVEQTTGQALIKVGDRMNAVYTMNGDLVQKIPNPPGAYIVNAKPIFGLNGTRNLLEVVFTSNDPGPASGGQ